MVCLVEFINYGLNIRCSILGSLGMYSTEGKEAKNKEGVAKKQLGHLNGQINKINFDKSFSLIPPTTDGKISGKPCIKKVICQVFSISSQLTGLFFSRNNAVTLMIDAFFKDYLQCSPLGEPLKFINGRVWGLLISADVYKHFLFYL